jgi:hypothetical protein
MVPFVDLLVLLAIHGLHWQTGSGYGPPPATATVLVGAEQGSLRPL